MSSSQSIGFITVADYLQSELTSETKHEYLEGQLYAMAGASKNHQRIISNLVRVFSGHLRNTPCDTFTSDIKVRIGDLAFFYPDIIVACEDNTDNNYYTESPVIIVEVLSKSTRRKDETTKRRLYQTMPSLQEYVLIEQDIVDIEICRRSQSWQSEHYFMGDEIIFAAIDLTMSVNEIYERVVNEDVSTFFDNV
ncbi:MAG: Uma2 family endonuclease [Methylococcales bacterium]|nr:Uma2 family endonuclease [Methylococcales bacterium]